MDSLEAPLPVPNSALQGTQSPIAKSDRRHGACGFGGESALPSRRFLLRHMQGRWKLLAPTGIFSSLRVRFRSARPFLGCVHRTPPCEFSVSVRTAGGQQGGRPLKVARSANQGANGALLTPISTWRHSNHSGYFGAGENYESSRVDLSAA